MDRWKLIVAHEDFDGAVTKCYKSDSTDWARSCAMSAVEVLLGEDVEFFQQGWVDSVDDQRQYVIRTCCGWVATMRRMPVVLHEWMLTGGLVSDTIIRAPDFQSAVARVKEIFAGYDEACEITENAPNLHIQGNGWVSRLIAVE